MAIEIQKTVQMIASQIKLPFSLRSTNHPQTNPTVTIYPKEVVFEDVHHTNCYEIPLFIRNEGKQIEKIRIIPPKSSFFKLKSDDGMVKVLAPGLAMNIKAFFSIKKGNSDTVFEDSMQVLGNSFQAKVEMRAYAPRQIFTVPEFFDAGRLLLARQNQIFIPVTNTGKRPGAVFCSTSSSVLAVPSGELVIQAGQKIQVPLIITRTRGCKLNEHISFSNGLNCVVRGTIVSQGVEIISSSGERLSMYDLGQVYMGQKVDLNLHLLNNTQKQIECIFETFSKNVEPSDIKIDPLGGNFVIKSLPLEYAKDMLQCCSSTKVKKVEVKAFEEMCNTLVVNKRVSPADRKMFQDYATDPNFDQIKEQAINETLVVKTSFSSGLCRVPIKFILAFPRVKISRGVLEYGPLKERTDNQVQVMLFNEGDVDLCLNIQSSPILKVEGQRTLKQHSSQQYRVILRPVRPGNIQESIHFTFFEGLYLEVKVFAECKGSVIRCKKIATTGSANDLSQKIRTNQSLGQLEKSLPQSPDWFNKTDTFSTLKAADILKKRRPSHENSAKSLIAEPNLTLKFSEGDYQKTGVVMKKMNMIRDNKRAVTLKEIAKYSKPLSLESLSKVALSESEIAFGSTFIDSEVTKEITVSNRSQDVVLFEWDTRGVDTLQKTSNQLVKLQPFSEKLFKIVYIPNVLGVTSFPVSYIVNRSHNFQLTLSAFVTLVSLDVPVKSVEMHFLPEEMSFEKSKEVELFNNGYNPAQCIFRFADNKHFFVNQESITIEPHSSQKVAVTYRPSPKEVEEENGQQRVDFDRLMAKVVGGAENFIRCLGKMHSCKVCAKEQEYNWQGNLISIPVTTRVTLKNQSKIETAYRVQVSPELEQYITIEKPQGVICGEERKQVNFTVLCHQPIKIAGEVRVQIRGMKTIVVPLEATFVHPQIEANRSVIDFGNIPIMGSNYQECIYLTNRYRSQIKLEYSNFFENQNYSVEIKEPYRHRTQKSIPDPEMRVTRKRTVVAKQDRSSNLVSQRCFRLQPEQQTFLEVKFIPKTLQKFQVKLPLKLVGTQGQVVQPVPVTLLCYGIEPVVYLQPQKVQFETIIIGEGNTSTHHRFTIHNPHPYPIEWQLENGYQTARAGVFDIDCRNGLVGPSESVSIQVEFHPEKEGHFVERLEVVLRDRATPELAQTFFGRQMTQGKVSHISLWLEGSAILPSIKFNCNQLLMPVGPVGVQSRAHLLLQNHGYDTITISRWKVSNCYPALDVQLLFHEGKLLSLSKKYLKVQVICRSSEALSVTTHLQFFDQFGNKYQLPVSCTFDRSMMTSYSYLEAPQRPPFVLDKKTNTVKLSSLPAHHLERSCSVSASQLLSCSFIKNWLNFTINLGIHSFPADIIASEGELLHKIINKMSNQELVRKYEPESARVYALYPYLCDVIKTLKVEGAYLNQIRPEFLLSYDDYMVYMHQANIKAQNDEAFAVLSVESWIALFYQLCKLYILPSVSEKMIGKFLPSTVQVPKSSVYSQHQMMLIKFISSFANDSGVLDLSDQMRFLELIQFSLQKFFGFNYSEQLMAMKVSGAIITLPVFNVAIARFLFSQLSKIGLSLYLNESDLYSLGPKELMIYLVSYLDMFSAYASCSTLKFEAAVGDRITKIIEIDNNASRRVKYRVRLLGSEEFEPEEWEVVIPAKSRSELRVVYQCRQNRQEEAKLYLVPIKDEPTYTLAQPLAFKLTATVLSKITLKKIDINAQLYSISTLPLEIELPIDFTDLVEFTVSIHQRDKNPAFYCFQNVTRFLRTNKDKLELRIVPLVLEPRQCRVCYRSPLYGEFNFEINLRIDPPPISKEIRLKQMRVNKQEYTSVILPKDNDQLNTALKYLADNHVKPDLQQTRLVTKRSIAASKVNISIVESSYISVTEEEPAELKTAQTLERDGTKVDLKCHFGKPFSEYSCTLLYRNDANRDIRYFKLITSVSMRPQYVTLHLTAKAREQSSLKIPITNTPCDCIVQNPHSNLTLQNINKVYNSPNELTALFAPEWIMEHKTRIVTQNKESLTQVIYDIYLKATEPEFFDKVSLEGSAVFEKDLKIPLRLPIEEPLIVDIVNSNRLLNDGSKEIGPGSTSLDVRVLPSHSNQICQLKLVKENKREYFWAQVSIKSQQTKTLEDAILEVKPLESVTYIVHDLALGKVCGPHIQLQETNYLTYQVVKVESDKNALQLTYCPGQEMQEWHKMSVMVAGVEYKLNIKCKAEPFSPTALPPITSHHLQPTRTSFHFTNPICQKATYSLHISPHHIFEVQHDKIDLKPGETKRIGVRFKPQTLQTTHHCIITLTSPDLPSFQYQLTAHSALSDQQQAIQCEVYTHKTNLKEIIFTNHFVHKQEFTIDSQLKGSPFTLVQPVSTKQKIVLQSLMSKRIIVQAQPMSKVQSITSGVLTVKCKQKKCTFKILPLQIKSYTSKKIAWNCKARQTYYEDIEMPDKFTLKSLELPPQLSPFLTHSVEEGTSQVKLKFMPMKPLAKQQLTLKMIGDKEQYMVQATVSVTEAEVDDNILVKTNQPGEVGIVTFKLTNTKKQPAAYQAYFRKGEGDLSLGAEKGILQPYGRPGTPIQVQFTSTVYNKRVEDELCVETSDMLWRFKVRGVLSQPVPTKR